MNLRFAQEEANAAKCWVCGAQMGPLRSSTYADLDRLASEEVAFLVCCTCFTIILGSDTVRRVKDYRV